MRNKIESVTCGQESNNAYENKTIEPKFDSPFQSTSNTKLYWNDTVSEGKHVKIIHPTIFFCQFWAESTSNFSNDTLKLRKKDGSATIMLLFIRIFQFFKTTTELREKLESEQP